MSKAEKGTSKKPKVDPATAKKPKNVGTSQQQQAGTSKPPKTDAPAKAKVVSRKAKVAAPPEAVTGIKPAATRPVKSTKKGGPESKKPKADPAIGKKPKNVGTSQQQQTGTSKPTKTDAPAKAKVVSRKAKVAAPPEAVTGIKPAATKPVESAKKSASEFKKSKADPMIVKRPKNFGIGGTVQPKRDLTRFVKWPEYIKVQRQRAVLYKRLKIPPSINQFRAPNFSKQSVSQVLKLLHSYRPESREAKKLRLRQLAAAKAKGEKVPVAARAPRVIFGASNVTTAIEKKKAKLVVIAADCDPLEVVLHLPALCRKMGIPYCIMKGGRARLGHLVHRKTASCVAISKVRAEDNIKLQKVIEVVKSSFNDKYDEIRRSWGGGVLGAKSKARKARLDKAKAKELSQKVAASVAV